MGDVQGKPKHPACSALKEAWHKVKGMKRSFWGAVAISTLVAMGGFCLFGVILFVGQAIYMPNLPALVQTNPAFFLDPKFVVPIGMIGIFLLYHIGQVLFEMFVLLPMRMGVRLIALRRAADKPIEALYVFKLITWKYIWRFVVLEVSILVVLSIPTTIGALLFWSIHYFHLSPALDITLYVLGILFFLIMLYLLVSYTFVNMLVIDRDITAWQAMKLSRQTITKRWFCIFGVLIWLMFVTLIGTILLFIGLIWTVPYVQNVIAILYRNMLGVKGEDPVTMKEQAM